MKKAPEEVFSKERFSSAFKSLPLEGEGAEERGG